MRRHSLIRSFFGIPEEHQIYCGMAIGHPDRTAPINTLRTRTRTGRRVRDLVRRVMPWWWWLLIGVSLALVLAGRPS